jgi:tetratricopeptide (TPR) repeat protein
MATALPIFVSHSHQDGAFCQALVTALRAAGADVWYDEHNLGAGHLMDVIQQELDRRKIFIVILSKNAFASKWVKRETGWAYSLYDRDPTRVILPVTASAIERDDFSGATGWLYLEDFKRIEAPGFQPYSQAEAVGRVLHALALTPAGEVPAPVAPQPTETADDLITRGRALREQGKHSEALSLFERATQLDPNSYLAWFNVSYSLDVLGRFEEALTAWDRAISLNRDNFVAWRSKGGLLNRMQRHPEALIAYEEALALNPTDARAWTGKSESLYGLQRYKEAIAAVITALEIDPTDDYAWQAKRFAVRKQAEAEYDIALALNPKDVHAWLGKAKVVEQSSEVSKAYEQAIALDPTNVDAWTGKAKELSYWAIWLGVDEWKFKEAEAAYERALALDPGNAQVWLAKGYFLDQWQKAAQANYYEPVYDLGDAYDGDDDIDGISEMPDSYYEPHDDKEMNHDGFHASKHLRWGQAAYDRALALEPNLAMACNLKGLMFYRDHDYKEAQAEFGQALALDSAYVEAWINKGNAHFRDSTGGIGPQRHENISEAAIAFDQALELDPAAIDAWIGKVRMTHYSHLESIYETALAAFELAATRDPMNAIAWLGKGAFLERLRRYDEAFAAYERTLALDPHDSRAWTGKGIILRYLHNYPESLAAFEQAILFNPIDADAWIGKARLFVGQKLYKDALAAFERAIALDTMEAGVWSGKAHALSNLQRYDEAAEAHARYLGQEEIESNSRFYEETEAATAFTADLSFL